LAEVELFNREFVIFFATDCTDFTDLSYGLAADAQIFVLE
jgi:hypothetical protein